MEQFVSLTSLQLKQAGVTTVFSIDEVLYCIVSYLMRINHTGLEVISVFPQLG